MATIANPDTATLPEETRGEDIATVLTYQCPANFSESMTYIGLDPEDPDLAMFACGCDLRRHWLDSKQLW